MHLLQRYGPEVIRTGKEGRTIAKRRRTHKAHPAPCNSAPPHLPSFNFSIPMHAHFPTTSANLLSKLKQADGAHV